MSQFTIPSKCVITKNANGGLLLLIEEPSKYSNEKRGYYKCLIPKNGKIYSNGLFVTRDRNEVFKTIEEAKNAKYCFLK